MIRLTFAELFVLAEIEGGDSKALLGELSAEQEEVLRGEGHRSMTARSLIRRAEDGSVAVVEELGELAPALFTPETVLTVVGTDPEGPPQLLTLLRRGATAVAFGPHSPGVFETARLTRDQLAGLVQTHVDDDIPAVLSVTVAGADEAQASRLTLLSDENNKVQTSDGRTVERDELETLVGEWFGLPAEG